MLEFIRKRSASILIKILFGLLILSFLTWGIGDLIRNQASDQTVAEVGDVEISPQELSDAYVRQINRFEQATGMTLDREQARSMGLLDMTLGQLVNDTLWRLGARSMGVTTSDETIREMIAADPSFKDQTGQFSQSQFEQVLLSNGYTEQSYVALLRQRIARTQVADSVVSGVTAPKAMVDALYRLRQEKRVAETIYVADEAMTDIPEPTEEQLSTFHSENPELFTAPEYRELTVLELQAKDLEDEVAVPDEEIQTLYDQRQAEFDKPESRTLSQIVVEDEATAQKAYEMLQEGRDFAAVAKDVADMDQDTIEIGDVTRNMLLAELADVAFDLPDGGISKPVKSPLGWHILRVDSVTPAHKQSLDEVRDRLRADLAHEKSIDALFEMANKLEDTLGGGATLEEVAQTMDLQIRHIDAISQTGHDRNGDAVTDLPPGGNFLNTAFETPVSTDSLLTEAGSDGYFILRVDSVTPSAVRPLDEVRDQVAAAWKEKRRAEKAKETAEDMAKRLEGEATLADLAADLGVEVATTDPFTRDRAPEGSNLTRPLVRELFAAKPGDAVSGRSGQGYTVARLKDVVPANPGTDSAGVAAMNDNLAASLQNDVQVQFSGALRREFPVDVNQKALESSF